MTTQQVIEALHTAWTTGNATATRALLADELVYENPLHVIRGADAFVPGLMRFAALLRGAPVLELIATGDRAAILYDCDLPAPVGRLRTAWFARVDNGVVTAIQSVFDATEIRPLAAKLAEGK
jgi:hypothetical protein